MLDLETMSNKDILEGIELLSAEDIKNLLGQIIQMIRDDKFTYPVPEKVFIPYRLYKALEDYNKNKEYK